MKSQTTEAEQYYVFLHEQEIALGTELIKLKALLQLPNGNLMQQYQIFKNQVNISFKNVEEENVYPKSKYLKEAALDYFEIWQHIAKHDLKAILDIYAKDGLDQADINNSQEYFKKIEAHIKDKEIAYRKAQQQYAIEHHFELPQQPFKFYLE